MEAQPSRNIPGARPFPNTPSDVSCSSGHCSVVSTRETSPASSTHYALETSSVVRDSLISCPDRDYVHFAIPSAGPDQSRPFRDLCRPRPGLDYTIPSPLEMNPNPFQSISGGSRSSKLTAKGSHVSHTSSGATPEDGNPRHRLSLNQQQFRQVLAPTPSQHHLQSIPPPSLGIHRVVRTPNWRSSPVSLDNLTSPSPTSNSTLTEPSSCLPRDTPARHFPHASSPSFVHSTVSNFDPRSNSSSRLAHHAHTTYAPVAAGLGFSNSTSSSSTQYRDKHPFEAHKLPFESGKVNMRPQNGKIIADSAMDRAMGYCYDRGGGQYTRLIPVDMLPVDLESIPRRVNTDEGMIVLPVPRQAGADGQPADAQLEQQRFATPPSSPNGHGNGIATTDSIQSRIDSIVSASPGPGTGPLVLATRGFDGSTPTRSMTTNQPTSASGSSGRREKIYCDKWIHDGTCAFTQQGCKYKHEMPHDRETQEKLGLFHGYPTWWKKQALENQRPLAIDDRPVNLNSGRPVFPSITSSASAGNGVSNAVVSSNWRAGPGPVVGDTGVQRSPSSPTPIGGGGIGRGSIGFGGGRGGGRQARTFGEYLPSDPDLSPSRAGPGGTHPFQHDPVEAPVVAGRNTSLTHHHPAASFTPASYGPIGPPSRAGGGLGSAAGSHTSAATAPTTRNSRSMTASSLASSGETGGGGAPYGGTQRSAFESGNPFAPLSDLAQQASGRAHVVRREDPESSSGDNTAADGEQRGAPL